MVLINEEIFCQVDDINNYLIETRRYLHENPELSSVEYNTSKFLKAEAKKLGLTIYDVKGTGFYAILDTKREGKTIGLRADIDALPIYENDNNLINPRICKSKNDGVFHACGHDGHMAILLATMKILVNNIDKLKGRIIFIFEEGEERGSGIDSMIDSLKNYEIDAIYGNHLASFLDTGEICVNSGPVMAGYARVDFTVKGKGGHGSRPDLSISPIFAAANIITALSSAWVNRLDPNKTVTLGLGSINGGNIPNVIPNEVRVTGTLRYFDLDEGRKAIDLIKKVGTLTAMAHECEFIENDLSHHNSPVINDENLANFMKKSMSDIMDGVSISDTNWLASETFYKYSTLSPSLFTLVGVRNESLGSGAQHHNEYFDIDEDGLRIATIAMVKFANDFLNS